MAHTVPWTKIKKEYLEGVTPRDLAAKYGVSAKTIGDKASDGFWTQKKREISEKVERDVQERIKSYADIALQELNKVLIDESSSKGDKISAARAILDVSGLKSAKVDNNITTKSGLTIKVEP
jgi:transposase